MTSKTWDMVRAAVTLILLISVIAFLWFDRPPGELLLTLGIVIRALFPTHTAKEPEKPPGVVR